MSAPPAAPGAGAARLAVDLRAGRVSAVRLAQDALARAAAARDQLGAFVVLTEEIALDAARRADRELAAGHDRGPLHGIPCAVKDVIDVDGVPTANGTAGLGQRLPERDAPAWAALRAGGAVLIGKTTTHELAWGATTPGCRNPLDLARSAGGSSGGSAAAVAAGVVPIALGTDTGGSIRLPAALCGVAGLRPASGTMPMEGITPLAPSQDVVGPIAASVADCAAAAGCLMGRPPPYLHGRRVERVGVVADPWATRLHPEVAAAFEAACGRLAAHQVKAVPIHVPLSELAPAASFVTMLAESAQQWWPAARAAPESVGAPVRALLRVGSGVPDGDRERARDVSEAIRTSLDGAMKDAGVDVCALPTVPVTARRIEAAGADVGGRRMPVEAAYVALTALASVTGHAALTVPCGADRRGLPIGVQLIAPDTGEAAMWRLAELLELERSRRTPRD